MIRQLARPLTLGDGRADRAPTDLCLHRFRLSGVFTVRLGQKAIALARAPRENTSSLFKTGVSAIIILRKTERELHAAFHGLPVGAMIARELSPDGRLPNQSIAACAPGSNGDP